MTEVAAIVCGFMMVSVSALAAIKPPFQPAKYDKVIPVSSDQSSFVSVGNDDSMGKRPDESIGGKPTLPTPNSPDKIEQEEPVAASYLLNCGCMKRIDHSNPGGTTECQDVSIQKSELGGEFYDFYGKGISDDNLSTYTIKFASHDNGFSVENIKLKIKSKNVEKDITGQLNGEYIVVEPPESDTYNKSCNIYLNHPMRSYVVSGNAIVSGGSQCAWIKFRSYIYIKPGFPDVTRDFLASKLNLEGGQYYYFDPSPIENQPYTLKIEKETIGNIVRGGCQMPPPTIESFQL